MGVNFRLFGNWLLRKIVLGLLPMTLCAACTWAKDKKYVYLGTAIVSSSEYGQSRLGEARFSLAGTISAGNFFMGLEHRRIDSPAGPADEFRKDDRVISLFPEELQITIEFLTYGRAGNKPSRLPSLAQVNELSRSLELDASWKRGVELRPADLLASADLVQKPRAFKYGVIQWIYTLRVRAIGVPLTDHLVVSVFGSDKRFLARVTFDLTSDPTGPATAK